MNFPISILTIALALFIGDFSAVLAQAPQPSPAVSHGIESEGESCIFSNNEIKAIISPSGISSWHLNKYAEELFGGTARISSDEKSQPVPVGLFFNSLLPQETQSKSLFSQGSISWSEPEKAYVSYLSSGKGHYLPEDLEIQLHWSFSTRYSGKLHLKLVNNSDTPLDIADNDGNPLFLYCYPLFSNDTYRSTITYVKGDRTTESLSPEADSLGSVKTENGYIGSTNQYYALAIKENTGTGMYVHTKRSITIFRGDEKTGKTISTSVVGWKFLWDKIRSNETLEASFDFYVGPKQENLLKEAGFVELFDTWSGITGPIGKIMFSLLTLLYSLTGHYGYAIILLTLLVKIMLHPLSRKQMVSMKKMQLIQPEMQKIKEKIKDPQKQQMAMQKLFVENEVNPIGGCLPLFCQLPIFIALYTCLSSAIELKNVSFLWLPDLSMPDPTYALPILFAVGNYFSMQANSAGTEQMPAMKYMPVMMFFFFMNLASGVLIYFVGQSVFSFVEQKYNKTLLDDPLTVEATPVQNEEKSESSEEKSCKKKKKKK